MNKIIALLRNHLEEHPPNFGDGDSVLAMLYECYNENNPFDSEQIQAASITFCMDAALCIRIHLHYAFKTQLKRKVIFSGTAIPGRHH